MAGTDTAGTVECEARAGDSDAAGCGIDASDDFEVFERTAALELDTHDMAINGPGEAATGGGGNTGAHATAAYACAADSAAADSGGGEGTEVADGG